MRKILFFLMVICLTQFSYSQSIRKDYREFTQQEMNDYVAGLNILFNNGTMNSLANEHAMMFSSEMHTTGGFHGQQFLSWHRIFMLDFETLLRNTDTDYRYLALPYWDWSTDRTPSNVKFWNNDFLANSKFPGVSFGRALNTSTSGTGLATTTNVADLFPLTTFFTNSTSSNTSASDFSHRLEAFHNYVHPFVGGVMSGVQSPFDPVFYLHHNQIDKLWQQWEDQNTGIQASATLLNINNPLMMPYQYITSAQVMDSRSIPRPSSAGSGRNMDVWYAKNGKVILDGANGTAFIANDTAVPYLYRYTAATTTGGTSITGEMYVGDVLRNSSNNVLTDTKGGFEINTNVTCDFKAGRAIVFMPGFVAKSGSTVTAKIISVPNAARQSHLAGNDDSTVNSSVNKTILYPNPNNGIFMISLYDLAEGTIQITNLVGQTVFRSDFKNQSEFEINMQEKPKGIYIVRVLSGNEVFTGKIIKN